MKKILFGLMTIFMLFTAAPAYAQVDSYSGGTHSPDTCPRYAFGTFSNKTNGDARLFITVNNKPAKFSITTDGPRKNGTMLVPKDRFRFPGIIYLHNLKFGDVVRGSLVSKSEKDYGVAAVDANCGANQDLVVGSELPNTGNSNYLVIGFLLFLSGAGVLVLTRLTTIK